MGRGTAARLCVPVRERVACRRFRRMDVSAYHHEDSVTIERDPAAVYAIISDVSRIGELSPYGGGWAADYTLPFNLVRSPAAVRRSP